MFAFIHLVRGTKLCHLMFKVRLTDASRSTPIAPPLQGCNWVLYRKLARYCKRETEVIDEKILVLATTAFVICL